MLAVDAPFIRHCAAPGLQAAIVKRVSPKRVRPIRFPSPFDPAKSRRGWLRLASSVGGRGVA